MNRVRFLIMAGLGCGLLLLLIVVAVPALFVFSIPVEPRPPEVEVDTPVPELAATQQAIPTLTLPPEVVEAEATPPEEPAQSIPGVGPNSLISLYNQVNPGVVSIQVYIQRGARTGEGAGSGFILDEQGHIVTNNHVIAGANHITVVFYNGLEANAEVVGADQDTDLAILRVEQLVEGARPLPLGDSDQVQVGEWTIAIGNPFGLGGSMSAGIVSAVGRTIPAGLTPFFIPQAIQTDAAINPGNSGGPLLNLNGEVIGVNAQIVTRGAAPVSAGVGFAIPSNIVRRIAPVLTEQGSYQWPWLGVQGQSVSLAIMQANELETQQGAYIENVVQGGPAAEAGLRGTRQTVTVNGLQVPAGGDVIVAIDDNPVIDFSELLINLSARNPGDQVVLTIIREGQRQEVPVTLAPRPSGMTP